MPDEDIKEDAVEAVEATDAPEKATEVTEQAPEDTEGTVEAPEAVETIVTFDDDEEPEKQGGNEWVKKLRKRNRDQAKRISELEQNAQPAPAEAQLGPAPTLESVDYDEAEYSNQLTNWIGQRDQVQNVARQRQVEADEQAKSWNNRMSEYEQAARDEFDKDTYAEAEDIIKATLDVNQQGIMVHAFGGKLAQLVMGLSKSDKRLQELGRIKDPVLFAVAIGKLESKMKVTQKRPDTQPEKRVISGAQGVVTTGDALEDLRAEAEKTGDYTKVIAYRAKLKRAG